MSRPVDTSNPTGAIIVALGLTLNEVADRAQVHRVNLSQWARGEKAWSRPALFRVAKVLGVPPLVLTGEESLADYLDRPRTHDRTHDHDEFEFES